MFWPTPHEQALIDEALGEHMVPTGNWRFHSYCPGITVVVFEREWKSEHGATIWVQAVYPDE